MTHPIRQAIEDAPETGEAGPCPVTALGHAEGRFYFLDAVGQLRDLSASQVGKREDLMSLFLDEGMWLTAAYPCRRMKKVQKADGSESEEFVTVDFNKNKASAWLMAECRKAGLFGEYIKIRRPGIWPGEDGRPIVHCGDKVFPIGKRPLAAGTREGSQIWAAAPPEPRPAGEAASRDDALYLEREINRLWNFRRSGGGTVLLGLLGCAYFGAAIPWRPAGFLTGAAGSGKSSLLAVIRNACPMRYFTNDTTKAGVEQSLDGRAKPTLIDEASDKEDQRGARALLDLVLSASGGDGTKGSRGGKDGKVRHIEVAGSILMASIAPPDMKAQHFGRFTIIDLDRAHAGADHNEAHKQLQAWATEHGARLWRRALDGWNLIPACTEAFREALKEEGCAPRDMDQLSALLTGYWVLAGDGSPPRAVGDLVDSVAGYIRDEADVLMQDASQQLANHLLSQIVQVQRSTERRSIADLIRRVLGEDDEARPDIAGTAEDTVSRLVAAEVLAQYGIRVIRANEPKNRRGVPAPRKADGLGIWFWPGSSPLKALFRDTPYSGQKFEYQILRFESARKAKEQIRIGANRARGCIWVSGEELGFGDGVNDG